MTAADRAREGGADAAAIAETRRIAASRAFWDHYACQPRGTDKEKALLEFRARMVARRRDRQREVAQADNCIAWVDTELAALAAPEAGK